MTKHKAYASINIMNTKTNTTLRTDTALLQTSEDMKNALLAVSVAINLVIFTAWLVIQVDPRLALILVQTT